MLPQAKALFRVQQSKQATRLAAELEKQMAKDTATCARELKCAKNTILETFNAPLTSYKYKDDLKDITAAFAIDQSGTISELTVHC